MRRYLEQKRAASGVEINVTHVAMKAASLALREMPALNGHIVGGSFFPHSCRDVSYLFPLQSEGGAFASI